MKNGDRLTITVDIVETRDQGNVAFAVGGTTCLAPAKAIEAAMVQMQDEAPPEVGQSKRGQSKRGHAPQAP